MEFKFVWNEEFADIGSYHCELQLEEGYTLSIGVKDNTCAYEQEQKKKNPVAWNRYHHYDYKVYGCWGGWLTSEGFNKPMTLEEVKIWAEDYLLDMLIKTYENTLANLEKERTRAEWAKQYKENRRKL